MDDLTTLVSQGHKCSGPQVETAIQKVYGIEGKVQRLDGERDDNFVLTTADGDKYFVKVAHSEETPEVTNFQTALLLHVAGTGTVPVPKIIRTTAGEPEGVIDIDGRQRRARITEFLGGSPFHKLPSTPELRRSLGQTQGHLNLALRDFGHPAADNTQLWDVARAADLRPMIDDIPRTEVADRLRQLYAHYEKNVQSQLNNVRRQVVHNDLSGDNLRGEDNRVTGVFDFGDSTRTAVVVDLAVTAAYQLDDSDTPLHPVLDILAGYNDIDPIEDAEVDMLFDTILARMLVRLTITEWRAEQFPDNKDYILRNNVRSWRVLDKLQSADPAEQTETIRKALR